MKKNQRNERILVNAAAFLLLSIILMIVIIPGILNDTTPSANPGGAATAISIALIIRLGFFIGYVRIIRQNRQHIRKKGQHCEKAGLDRHCSGSDGWQRSAGAVGSGHNQGDLLDRRGHRC